MSIDLTTVDGDGLFDILGKAIHAAKTLITATGTTVPAEVADFIEQYKLWTEADDQSDAAMASFRQAAESSLTGGANSLLQQVAQVAATLLVRRVAADGPQPSDTVDNALAVLLAQMIADEDYVSPNVVDASLAAGASNSSTDLTIAYSLTRGDGRDEEDALEEDITFTVLDAGGTLLGVSSPGGVESTSLTWPIGSGVNATLSVSSASLLTNPTFEEATYDHSPDGWLVYNGSPGTDFLLSTTEVGRIVVSSSPTDGYYLLGWSDPVDGVVRYSATQIPFDADGPTVQAALRSIPGLEAVTVETTGTSPNFTHDVTFTGVAGNIDNLLVIDHTVSGSIVTSQVTAGEDQAFRATSLVIVGDGSTVPQIFAPVVLEPKLVYFIHFRARRNSAASAGTLAVGLTSGIPDTLLEDAEGADNELSVTVSGLPTASSVAKWFSVRLADSAPQVGQYLRFKATGVPNTGKIWIDDVFVQLATQLYPGGPFVAAFPGKIAGQRDDAWTLSVTNDRAGEWQTWFDRLFSMRFRGLLLPSAGTNLLNDSLIG